MSEPLATIADAEDFGIGPVTEASLRRASARVRTHTGQTITTGTSTIEASGPAVLLPQRPVQRIAAVTTLDGRPVDWELEPGSILRVPAAIPVRITYRHGHTEVPDGLVELVCTIARRLETLNGSALEAGVASEGAAGEQVSFGGDAWGGVGGLTKSEKDTLARLFPRRVRTIVSKP